ncbi:MAG: glycerate kinase [Chitinophagaceae bacterium]|nr:glycerate kinase [Chitinophagaceae bacterium]
MKIIIAPDKFKGSLTSFEVCSAIREGILLADKKTEVSVFPMADGGDGFAGIMKYYTGTVSEEVVSVDALGRNISSFYESNAEDYSAIIELASCSGLAMLQTHERNPLITSTYGTGLQIRYAIRKGAKKIILGIGGSATNDAGIGILSALGFTFIDNHGNPLMPCGQSLVQIKKIIPPDTLPAVHIEIACDVNNPLYGPEGAATIFSPQKGANPEQVVLLDKGLKQFADVVLQQTGKDVSGFAGAGAAGGIAAGLMAFLPVNIVEGTHLILTASKIEKTIGDADMIITGEGKIDRQSLLGKTVHAIISMAKNRNIPIAAICGKLELKESEWKQWGVSLAVEINDGSLAEEESMQRAYELVLKKAEWMLPLLKEISGQ